MTVSEQLQKFIDNEIEKAHKISEKGSSLAAAEAETEKSEDKSDYQIRKENIDALNKEKKQARNNRLKAVGEYLLNVLGSAAGSQNGGATSMQAPDIINNKSEAKKHEAESVQRIGSANRNLSNSYNEIKNLSDYKEHSKYDSSFAKDKNYAYINGDENTRNLMKLKGVSSGTTGVKNEVLFDVMTEDEKGIYNYLYKKEGKKSAKQYLDSLASSDKGMEALEKIETDTKKLTEETPVLMGGLRVVSQVPEGISSIVGKVGEYTGDELLENKGYQPSVASGSINREINEEISEKTKEKELPFSKDLVIGGENYGNLYTNAYNALDAASRAAVSSAMLGGGAGGAFSAEWAGGRAAQAFINTPISASAYGDSYYQKRKAGMSDEEAKKEAVREAVVEWSTEMLGGFFGKESNSPMLNEGLEELTGNIMQRGLNQLDAVNNNKDSDIQKEYEQYIDNGMSAKEAVKTILSKYAAEDTIAFLSAFVPMGGTSFIHNTVNNNQINRNTGQQIKAAGAEAVQAEINTGLEMDSKSNAYKAAAQLQATLNNQLQKDIENRQMENAVFDMGENIRFDYGKLSSRRLGQLQRYNTEQGSRAVFSEAVQNEENADTLNKAFEKITKGRNISRKEAAAIKASQTAIDAINSEFGTDYNSKSFSKSEGNYLSRVYHNDSKYNAGQGLEALGDTARLATLAQQKNETQQSNEIPHLEAKTVNMAVRVPERAIRLSNGNAEYAAEIESVENGNVKLKTSDGQTVSFNEVEFENPDVKSLYNAARNYSTNEAKAFVNGYFMNGYEGSLADYAAGFHQVRLAKAQGKEFNEALSLAQEASNITLPQATLAYGVLEEKQSEEQAKAKTFIAPLNMSRASNELKTALQSKSKPGATIIARKGKMTAMNKSEIKMLDEIGKSIGREIIIVADTERAGYDAANGMYINGKVVLPLNADGGMMSVYLGHELFHDFKQNVPELAQQLENFVIDRLKNDASYNYQQRLEEVIDDNKFEEKYDTREEAEAAANEEIAANACFGVLSEKDNFETLVKDNRKLAKKVRDFFQSFLNKIKKALEELTKNNKEYQALHNDYEAQQKILEMFNECLNAEQNSEAKGSTEAKYSIKEIEGKNDNYGIGVLLDTDIFEGLNKQEQKKAFTDFVYSNLAGSQVVVYNANNHIEIIEFAESNERVRKQGNKNTNKVIKKLAIKTDRLERHSVVHSVELITASQKQKYYNKNSTHNWLDKNGWEFRKVYIQDAKSGKIYTANLNIANTSDGRKILYDINKIIEIDKGNVAQKGVPTISTSNNNIPQKAEKSKAKFSLKENYMQAAEQGDEATAQKLVDEAAMMWGAYSVDGETPLKLYHGTQRFGFTEFDLNRMDDKRSIFLTSDLDTASTYSSKKHPRRIGFQSGESVEKMLNDLNERAFTGERWEYLSENETNNLENHLLTLNNEFIQNGNKLLETLEDEKARVLLRKLIYFLKEKNFTEATNCYSEILKKLNSGTNDLIWDVIDTEVLFQLKRFFSNNNGRQIVIKVNDEIFDLFTKEELIKIYKRDVKRYNEFGNYSLYAKFANPLIVDGRGNNWNKIRFEYETYSPVSKTPYTTTKTMTTREIAKYASEKGYDGVIFKNVVDNGGRGQKHVDAADYIMVVFNPENVKSADPITYDNEDNTIPLDKRFTESKDIRYSRKESKDTNKKYSYDFFAEKPDMPITAINDKKEYTPSKATREAVVESGLKSALSVGHKDNKGNTYVYVNDIDTNILVSKKGLRHSLDRRLSVVAPVTENIGTILKNSIRINELIPKGDNIEKSYALIGIAKNDNNEPYVVSFVVNRASNEIMSIDVLYAVNAKKEATALIEPELSSQSDVSLTASVISITDLLDYVNKYYPDILPEEVLKHYCYDSRPEGKIGENALYSRKENLTPTGRFVMNLLDENEELRQASDDLKEALKLLADENKSLKNEFKITGRHNLNQSKVNKVSSELLKSYSSKYDKSILTSKISKLYDYMVNAGQDINEDYIWSTARDIAKNIIDNSQMKDTTVYDDYAELRRYIRTTRIIVPEKVKNQFEDFESFRRKNMSRLRIVKEYGTELDSFYTDIARQYPEFFEEGVAEEQQLELLSNFFEATQPIYINPVEDIASGMGFNMEQYANLVAGEIFDKFFEVKTVAEKHKEEIERLKLHYNNQFKELRESYKNRYEQRLKELKEDNKGKVKKLREDKQKALDAQKAHFEEQTKKGRERRRRSAVQEKIKKLKARMDKRLLNPTDNSYVPQHLIKAVADVCNAINEADYEKANGQLRSENVVLNLDSLGYQYEALKHDNDYDYASEYEEGFAKQIELLQNALNGKQIRQLSAAQLEDVYTVLRTIENIVLDAKKQIGREEAITNYQARKRAVNEIMDSGGMRNKVIGLYEHYAMNSMRFIRAVTEYNENAELYKQFLELEKGQRKADSISMELSKPFQQMRSDNKKEWDRFNRQKVETFLRDSNGNPVFMTEAQIAQLFLTAKRRQGLNHLIDGGFTVYDAADIVKGKYMDASIKNAQEVESFSLNEALRLFDDLSDFAKDYIQAAEFMFNVLSTDYINETSLILKHRKLATTKNYIPLAVNQYERLSEIEGIKYDSTIEGAGTLKTVNINAKQGLIIEGLPKVIDKHVAFVSQYAGLAIPIRNFNKMYGGVLRGKYKGAHSVREALDNKWSSGKLGYATKIIDNVIKDLQTPRSSESIETLNKLESAWVQATLAANISVTLKQAASYPTAAAVIEGKYLNRAMFDKYAYTHWVDLCSEIDEHTGTHYKRRLGMSVQEIAEITKKEDALLNKIPAAFNPLKWIQAMDCRTTATLWLAAKYKVEAENKDIEKGSDEYWDKVTELYDECIEKTQPNYDILHRAEIQKITDKRKLIFSLFQTQPLQNTGLLYDSLFEWQTKARAYKSGKNIDVNEIKQARKNFFNVVQSQAIAAAVFSAMTLLAAMLKGKMTKYRDEDDEVTLYSIIRGLMSDVGSTVLNNILPLWGTTIWDFGKGVKSGIDSVKAGKGFKIDMYDLFTYPSVSTLNDTVDSIIKLSENTSKLIDGKMKTGEYIDSATTCIAQIASLTGLPISNIYSSGKGIKYMLEDVKNGKFGTFEAGKRKTNNSYDGLYKTLKEYGYSSNEYKEAEKKVIEEKKAAGTEKPNVEGAMKDRALKEYYQEREKAKKKGSDNYDKYNEARERCIALYGTADKVEKAYKKLEEKEQKK